MTTEKPSLGYVEREDGSLLVVMRFPQGDTILGIIPKEGYADQRRVKDAIDKHFSEIIVTAGDRMSNRTPPPLEGPCNPPEPPVRIERANPEAGEF